MKKFSVLEYLHPDGTAHTSLFLGSNCPEILRPELQPGFDGNADLFILAPSAKESNSQVWLEAAVQAMSDYLSKDGIGYVLVPPRWRWKIVRLLNRAGLVMDRAFWHFPDVASSRYLTPLGRLPGEFAVDTILPAPSVKRTLATLLLKFWGTRLFLMHFWNHIGISVRRPGARPFFEWLFKGEQQASLGTAIIRTSWRGSNGAHIAYGFSRKDRLPSRVAKTVAVENANSLKREAQMLQDIGPVARRAGMRVPEIIGKHSNEQYSSLLLTFLPGQSLSDLLSVKPDRFTALMSRIVDWLEQWNRATVLVRPLKGEQLDKTLLAPLNKLAPSLPNANRYRDWLVGQVETIGNPVPFVASHNDLTTANILLDERDQLGVVDWETSCHRFWPLTDFYYAVTDAVRIATNRKDWVGAFKACHLPDGTYSGQVIAWRKQLESAISSPPGFAELCFHVCWLHHASNEQLTSQPGEPQPFLEIVQWLALDESKFNPN